MVDKKEDYGTVSYVLGIVSIVFAFFSPLAGLVLGIVGFRLGRGQKSSFAKKGAKLSKIGIVISLIILVIAIVVAIVSYLSGGPASSFPVV